VPAVLDRRTDRASERLDSAISLGTLIAFRLVVTTVLLLAGGYVGSREIGAVAPITPWFFWFLGFAFSLNVAYLGILSRVRPRVQVQIQVFGDLMTITGLVYFTGVGAASFVILYPIVVLIGAIMFRGGVPFAITATTLYALLLFSVRKGLIPPAGLFDLIDARNEWVVGSIAFVAVPCAVAAAVGQVLASSLAQTGERLQDISGRVADLTELNDLIVRTIPSGLLLSDRAGLITFVNERGAELLGRRPDAMLGTPLDELFPPTLLRADPGEMETRPDLPITTPDGRPRLLGASVSRLEREQWGSLVVFRDLTELRRLEEQVRANERLAAAGQLAAQMAHEIRNPLGAIAGAAQLLASGERDPAESDRKLLEIISRESRRLSETLQGFLAGSPRVASATPPTCDLAQVAREVLALAELSPERLPEHRIEMIQEAETLIAGIDASSAKQVLWNVVRNGLEAMPKGGRLLVRVGAAVDRARIAVSDEGVGFAGVLANPGSVSTKPGGNGIGLALVHRIVAANSGRIRLASAEAGGGLVEIELPAASPGR
jgi:two-component system sensor histidine kinase PilS (NtrC family)